MALNQLQAASDPRATLVSEPTLPIQQQPPARQAIGFEQFLSQFGGVAPGRIGGTPTTVPAGRTGEDEPMRRGVDVRELDRRVNELDRQVTNLRRRAARRNRRGVQLNQGQVDQEATGQLPAIPPSFGQVQGQVLPALAQNMRFNQFAPAQQGSFRQVGGFVDGALGAQQQLLTDPSQQPIRPTDPVAGIARGAPGMLLSAAGVGQLSGGAGVGNPFQGAGLGQVTPASAQAAQQANISRTQLLTQLGQIYQQLPPDAQAEFERGFRTGVF